MFATTRRRAQATNAPASGSLLGDVAKFMVTRSVLTRFGRVGGVPGLLLSAGATYALNRYMNRRR